MPVVKIDNENTSSGSGQSENRQPQKKGSGNRKTLILIAVAIAIIVGIVAGIGSCISFGARQLETAHEGQVQAPVSGFSVAGKNYKDVQKQFSKAGFTQIQLEPEGDLIAGLLHKEGDVDEVSIDGATSYASGSWFNADANVVIRYHSYPKRDDSSSSSSSAAGGRPQKDAFESSEKTTLEVAGLKFQIPAYFKKNKESSKNNPTYYAATGKRLAMLTSLDMGKNASDSADAFYDQEDDFADEFLDGSGLEKAKRGDVTEMHTGGCDAFSFDFSGKIKSADLGVTGRFVAFFNEKNGKVGTLCLLQSDKSHYDYTSDFDKIVASGKAS